MNRNLGAKILVLLSMVYGLSIALIASLDLGDVAPVALIGAVVLAILWVALGMFGKADSPTDKSES